MGGRTLTAAAALPYRFFFDVIIMMRNLLEDTWLTSLNASGRLSAAQWITPWTDSAHQHRTNPNAVDDGHTAELVFAKQLAEGRSTLGEQVIGQIESDEPFFDLGVRETNGMDARALECVVHGGPEDARCT